MNILINNLKAKWKHFLSFTKSTWDLDDYPLRYKKQVGVPGQYNIGELKPWVVQIVNWWGMSGVGDTRGEAYEMLKNDFDNYSKLNKLPRPGVIVPIQFSSTAQIDELEDVAIDFFDKILDMRYSECFISDDSNLREFGSCDNDTLDKVNSAYGLGLSDLGDGNILRLLTLITDKKGR